MAGEGRKLGFQGTWSMAVGGMVGGGIFSTLGVVIGVSGRLAWLSFVSAGLVALLAGYSYVRLAAAYGEGAGRSRSCARPTARASREVWPGS